MGIGWNSGQVCIAIFGTSLAYAHFTSNKAWNKGYLENVCISQGIGGEGF